MLGSECWVEPRLMIAIGLDIAQLGPTNFVEEPSWGPRVTARVGIKSELKTLLSPYRAHVPSFLIAHREFDAAVAEEDCKMKVLFFPNPSFLYCCRIFSLLRRFLFCVRCRSRFNFLLSLMCILRCFISLCAFCSSTSRIPPLDARRSSRSTTIWNCNYFTLFFNYKIFRISTCSWWCSCVVLSKKVDLFCETMNRITSNAFTLGYFFNPHLKVVLNQILDLTKLFNTFVSFVFISLWHFIFVIEVALAAPDKNLLCF